jgi:rhodanese-related sulfurtransferase
MVLNTIPEKLELLKGFKKPIIAVCKSGGRSQSAADFLSQNGLDVINGGPWQNVATYVN